MVRVRNRDRRWVGLRKRGRDGVESRGQTLVGLGRGGRGEVGGGGLVGFERKRRREVGVSDREQG